MDVSIFTFHVNYIIKLQFNQKNSLPLEKQANDFCASFCSYNILQKQLEYTTSDRHIASTN